MDAKTDPDFIVMARTDALAVDGFDAVLERVVGVRRRRRGRDICRSDDRSRHV